MFGGARKKQARAELIARTIEAETPALASDDPGVVSGARERVRRVWLDGPTVFDSAPAEHEIVALRRQLDRRLEELHIKRFEGQLAPCRMCGEIKHRLSAPISDEQLRFDVRILLCTACGVITRYAADLGEALGKHELGTAVTARTTQRGPFR